MAETIAAWSAYMQTPGGAQYLARRVRVGARVAAQEQERLDNWLRRHAVLNGDPMPADPLEEAKAAWWQRWNTRHHDDGGDHAE